MDDEDQAVASFHREVNVAVARLTEYHRDRLKCARGCCACCVDDISVFEVEAAHIRTHHAALLEEGTPHAPGACAFLDGDGACRIYAHRPYVCRTQGLPLRWIDDDTAIEHRDICELNIEGEPLSELDMDEMWTIGPTEIELQRLQDRQGDQRRVALRDLFQR